MYWLHTLLQAPIPRIEVIPATTVFVTLIQKSNPAGAVGGGLSEDTVCQGCGYREIHSHVTAGCFKQIPTF